MKNKQNVMSLEGIEKAVDEYASRFVSQTQKLLDDRVTTSFKFVDATLNFNNGKMTFTDDMAVFSLKTVINPARTFPVKTAQEAFEYLKQYVGMAELVKEDGCSRAIADLNKYCQN